MRLVGIERANLGTQTAKSTHSRKILVRDQIARSESVGRSPTQRVEQTTCARRYGLKLGGIDLRERPETVCALVVRARFRFLRCGPLRRTVRPDTVTMQRRFAIHEQQHDIVFAASCEFAAKSFESRRSGAAGHHSRQRAAQAGLTSASRQSLPSPIDCRAQCLARDSRPGRGAEAWSSRPRARTRPLPRDGRSTRRETSETAS